MKIIEGKNAKEITTDFDIEEKRQIYDSLVENLHLAKENITIKTFMGIKNINKPHKTILKAYTGILYLFCGVIEGLPQKFLEKKKLLWKDVKAHFSLPVNIMKGINNYKYYCQEN